MVFCPFYADIWWQSLSVQSSFIKMMIFGKLLLFCSFWFCAGIFFCWQKRKKQIQEINYSTKTTSCIKIDGITIFRFKYNMLLFI